jgi:hypothetical protein
MAETLLSITEIILYGRLLTDIEITQSATTGGAATHTPRPGVANLLVNALRDDIAKPYLARIYAFAYEGHYYDLAKPVILLVHGPGEDVGASVPTAGLDQVGVAASAAGYAGELKLWRYDKSDISIRLDAETGTLEQILLETELKSDRLKNVYSGLKNVMRNRRDDDS